MAASPDNPSRSDRKTEGQNVPVKPVQTYASKEAKPGRARDLRSRESILEATRQLAKQQTRYRDLSMEKIATLAQSSKATIYRWWASKADLVRDACLVDRIPPPPGDSLREDLAHLIRQQALVYEKSASAPIFAGAWAELVENKTNHNSDQPLPPCPHLRQFTALIANSFERAISRGEWQGPYRADAAYDVANGLLLYRVIGRSAKISPKDITRLVEQMLLAASPLD